MKKLLSINFNGFKHVYRQSKWLLPLIALGVLFGNLAPYVNIYMSAEIINELASGRDTRRLITLAVFTISADLLIVIIKGFMVKLKDYQKQVFENKEQQLFMEYGFKMDYALLEDPEIQNRRAKIDESARINNFGIQSMLFSFENIAGNIVDVILSVCFTSQLFVSILKDTGSVNGLTIFLISLIVLIALSVFISLVNSKVVSKNYDKLSNTMLRNNRIKRGFPTSYQIGKDIRMYNMKELHRKQTVENRKIFSESMRKLMFGSTNINIFNSISTQGLNFAVYAFVCLNAVRGLFDVGGVIKYAGFISKLVNSINGLLGNATMLETNLPFLEHYLKFFEIENKMYQGTIPVEKRGDNEYEIEFRNVSFKYPGAEAYALKNLSMKFSIGQRMAVVGQNGSGKTTMIKLLCRLYDPTEGIITLNGIDIKKYDYEEYLQIFSVVYQDFKLFSFTLGQNVATAVDYDTAAVIKQLNMAGFSDRLNLMPKGLETSLYKDFDEDGMEVSGGEAQKIALARALYKKAPFIVLDEPTAALDPIAEYEIYSRFNEIAGNKTAIYISHRLSSCRFCDDIAVFHEGELIQRGSHDTLLNNENGKYYDLWHAQAQYYNEKTAS